MDSEIISINKSEILEEDIKVKNELKYSITKWTKFKIYINKKSGNKPDNRNKHIYIKTLSVASVNRTLKRIYNKIFRSRYHGYEKFLSEEEKRFIYTMDSYMVEGV